MLARNFLDASTLKVSENELQALIKVLGMLERDEFEHHTERKDIRNKYGFNMGCYHSLRSNEHSCGTQGCIMGWANYFDNTTFSDISESSSDIEVLNLFYADFASRLTSVRPEQAAQALRNFLTTGKSDWRSILD
jgi:hypothetical protein